MRENKRFGFWRVFWVILALYVLLMLLAVIVLLIVPLDKSGKGYSQMLSWGNILSQLFSLSFSSLFYYFSLNSFYRLFAERQSAIQFVKPSVIALMTILAYHTLNHIFFSEQAKIAIGINTNKPLESIPAGLLIFVFAFSALFYIGISMLVSYLVFLRDEKKQRKILEEQKMQLEVEKSQANFNFLKAQINPHFLHNTLNFLYAKSLPYSAELSEGILTLSDIMRYALSEGNAKDGKAPLRDEIEHVRNVIKINQLRFSNNLNVRFDVEGVVNGATIIPFVLITLVENAFKHGDLKTPDAPIDIKLKVKGHSLYFYCRNKKKTGPKELSTGIGLENIKKRLELAYGKAYTLHVKDEAEFYTTELTINNL